MAERTVYILLTRSGTCFSRFIHLVTRDGYTHASIGLDTPQGPFYSFGRKYPRLILPAGLVEERVGQNCWSAGRQVPCCLYALTVPEETYRLLRRRLDGMYADRARYHYNLLGALACYFQLSLSRRRHYFCSQFVAALLQDCGAVALPKSPTLLRPSDLSRLDGLRPLLRGDLEGVSALSA